MSRWMVRRFSGVVVMGLAALALGGCGEPAQPGAPGAGSHAEADGSHGTTGVPAKPGAAKPETKPAAATTTNGPFAADGKLSTEQQGLAFARHLQAKLEAKDYRWIYDNVLPPEQAAEYHKEKPLDDFIREFGDKGEAAKLLQVLKTVKEEDFEVDREDADRVFVPWKDSWPNQRDLVFLRIHGHWYLGS